MLVLIFQSALLLAVAFILGCVLGCLLRRSTARPQKQVGIGAAADAGAAAAAVPLSAEPQPDEIATAFAEAEAWGPAKASVPPAEPIALMPAAPAAAAAKRKPSTGTERAPKKASPAALKKTAAKDSKAGSATLKPPKAGTSVDNLKLIKGVGLQNEARLNALGVIHFDQIAAWKKADVEAWGMRLAFPGRIEREDWVGQAKVLAGGGSTQFASRVRRGTVATSVGKGTVGDLGTKPRTLHAPRGGQADDLTRIDGIGKALEKRLFGIGIYHFDQIAKLTPRQAKWVGIAVGFPGRVEREGWIGEAKELAKVS